MTLKNIPLYKPYITAVEKKLANEALDSGWISSRGKFVDEFETKFAEYVGRKYAVSVCNGTCALHLALEALSLPKGSGVICPTLTYVSTANAIRYAGLVPIFVNCNENSLSEYEHFKRGFEIAKENGIKISAIMPVHLYGRTVDVERLKEFNVPIVEDCAESFGSIFNGKVSGSNDTELACFSFFGNKVISCGEGGMVVTNNNELYKKCLLLKGVGQSPNTPQRYLHLIVGYNYRMTNIQSAIGLGQLFNSDVILSKKRNIAKLYNKKLKEFGLDDILLPSPDGCVGNEWLITIKVKSNSMREGLMLYLNSNGIENRPAFLPMHTMVNLGSFYRTKDMQQAEDIGACGINLPSYPELQENEIDYVCSCIKTFIEKY